MSLSKNFKLAIAAGSMMLLSAEVSAQTQDSIPVQPQTEKSMTETVRPYNLKRLHLQSSELIKQINNDYNTGRPVPVKKYLLIKLVTRANNSKVA